MKVNLENWNPDDPAKWGEREKKIAWRNLAISVPNLLLAFAVWIMWSIISAHMREHGFHFGLITPDMSPEELEETWSEIRLMYWTLPAIAGLSGATLRIPNSFLVALGGGRNVIFTTTALMLVPAIGTAIALQDVSTSYLIFAGCALLSGLGGGAFSSSMSNISYFFPKKEQGTALGLNAGIGNLGVGFMQWTLPIAVGFYLFSAVDADGEVVTDAALAGVQNNGWFWVPLLALCAIAAFFGMNNTSTGTPKLPGTFEGVFKTLYLIAIGVGSAGLGAWMLIGLGWNMWAVLPITIVVTLALMKFATPSAIKESLNEQFSIFEDKHNWVMTIIYTMTFGSFIGYSAAFPLLSQDLFVYTDPTDSSFVNPNAPNYMLWAFVGPMAGALIRPVGGWLSDKIESGSRVTHWTTITQIVSALALAYIVIQVRGSASPEDYWWPFFGLFMVQFLATGVANGSTFRTIPNIFSKKKAGPVLGWTAAVGAYGSFVIPRVFGEQIELGHAEYALYGFAAYYVICLALNWWYYLGPKREFDKP